MNWFKQLFTAVMMTIVLMIITGIIYPLVVTALSQVLFKEKAQGSLIVKDGKVVGSRLIGQPFSGDGYFHSRPSAAGKGYDGTASGGTNLGPTSAKLRDNIKTNVEIASKDNPGQPVPVDLVTTSASGLDPHITPAAADYQVSRVARVRGLAEIEVRQLVQKYTVDRQFGLLGEPRVNVLELNLALDEARPLASK